MVGILGVQKDDEKNIRANPTEGLFKVACGHHILLEKCLFSHK